MLYYFFSDIYILEAPKVSATVTSSNNKLLRTDVSHLKSGGISKRVTRSKSKDGPEEESDDVVVVATHPAGTLATQRPMDKVPQSLPAVSAASTSGSNNSGKASTDKKSSRARRTQREPPSLKSDKTEKVDKTVKTEKSEKIKKKKEVITKKSEKGPVTKVTTVSHSEASSLPSSSTPLQAVSGISGTNTPTVSITSTHVAAAVQKQFGDNSARKRMATASPSGSAPKVQKITPIPSSQSAFGAPNVPSSSQNSGSGSGSGSAAALMSGIRPAPASDLMPRRNTTREHDAVDEAPRPSRTYVAQFDNPQPSSSSRSRDPSAYPGFNLEQNQAASGQYQAGPRQNPPGPSRSNALRARVDRSVSLERGHSQSRSDYRPNRRSVSIPVYGTYNLLPGNGVSPQMQEFNLDLVTPTHHGK